jgi:four helix bundle protein
MNPLKTHRDLDVWKVSMDLVIDLNMITETFPNAERFGLVMQIRRAGVSICSNIAEGAARSHSKEFVHFLYISLGSVSEVETQLEIALRLEYLKSTDTQKAALDRIRRMLVGLIKHVTRHASRVTKFSTLIVPPLILCNLN